MSSLIVFLSSCYAQEKKMTNITLYFSDGIVVSKKYIDVKSFGSYEMGIEIYIKNNSIRNVIKKLRKPIIRIKINDSVFIAKPNWVFSSAVPAECDYFYATDNNGQIIFYKNRKIIFDSTKYLYDTSKRYWDSVNNVSPAITP